MADFSHERVKAPNQFALHTTRLAAAATMRALGGLDIIGADNIHGIDGPYAQLYKHRSLLDIPALGVAAWRADRQQLVYMAKKELNKPVLGWWLGRAGTFYIDRKVGLTPEQNLQARQWSEYDAAFAIAPEGHRNRGPLDKKHLKSMVVAPFVFEHGTDVVPVGIDGTEPGDIGLPVLAYGEPISVEKVPFEPDPEWDAGLRLRELLRAIKEVKGPKAIDGLMAEIFEGMSAADTQAITRRRERLEHEKLPMVAMHFNSRPVKERSELDYSNL